MAQVKTVPRTRRKNKRKSARRAKRRIQTAGMIIPRRKIGDCVHFESVEFGIYEFRSLSVILLYWSYSVEK